MIHYVAEHRFLRSSHLVDLMQRPADKVLRRLALLYHNGFLDRPTAQHHLFGSRTDNHLIYALGRKAPLLFGAADGIDWTDKNRSVKHPYIEHTLMVADFMVALECAARSQPGIRLLSSTDIADHLVRATGRAPHSWTMSARIPGHKDEIAVTPDKVFGLEFTDTGRRNYFLLEADRSTMPIARSSLVQTSFKKKLLTYHHGHEAKRHVDLWGIPGFRVLTITRSAERIESMRTALNEVTRGKGSNVFLFAELTNIFHEGPLVVAWRTGRNHTIRLAVPHSHADVL